MDTNQVMRKFEEFINEGKFESAKHLIKRHSKNRSSKLDEELSYAGIIHGMMNNYVLAIFCFELAYEISRNPQIRKKTRVYLAEACNGRGIQLRKTGLVHEAELLFRRALHLNPDSSQIHNNFAILLKKQGRFPEAEQEYKTALSIKPDDYEVHHNYALLLIAEGKTEEAEKQLGMSAPYYNPAKITYGVLLMNQSKLDEAKSLFLSLLEIDHEEPELFGNLGVISFSRGEYPESVEYFEKAKELFVKKDKIKGSMAAAGYIDWVKATIEWASSDIDTSLQLMKSASEKFSQSEFMEQSFVLNLLSLLIPFDKRLMAALESRTLTELREHIANLYSEAITVVENVRSPKLPHFQIILCKCEYIKILHHALQFESHDRKRLEEAREIFSRFDFDKDFQLTTSLDNFLREISHYRSLDEIPPEEEQKFLRMIQPFYVLDGMVTREFQRRAIENSPISLLVKTMTEKFESLEMKIDDLEMKIDEIITRLQAHYKETIDALSELNEKQLQEFQKSVEETIREELDSIKDTKKKEEAERLWDKLRKLASTGATIAEIIALLIQIYQIVTGQSHGAIDHVMYIVKDLLKKIQ